MKNLTDGELDIIRELEADARPTTCEVDTCIQDATHTVNAVHVCCYHYNDYAECDCTDDDYADAMGETAMGSYNGKVPSDFDASQCTGFGCVDGCSDCRGCPECFTAHDIQDCPAIRERLMR